MYCTRCGQPLAADSRYCVNCGAAVSSAAPAEAAPAPTPEAPAAAYAPGTPAPPVAAWPSAPAAETSEAAAPPPETVRYAGFWRRFWGLVVDSILLSAVLMPLRLGLRLGAWREFERGDMSFDRLLPLIAGSFVLFVVHLVADALYFSLMQSSVKQATLGQMLLGLRVTDLEGRRISGMRSLGRFFAAWLSSLTLLVGYVICVFTQKKQTLHDLLAGTLVVRT